MVEESFKRAYDAEVARKDSGIWAALYSGFDGDSGYNVIGDSVRVKIPRYEKPAYCQCRLSNNHFAATSLLRNTII